MFMTLDVVLNARWVAFGNGLWRQRHGVPIGGRLSDVEAALLGMMEQAWSTFASVRRLGGCCLPLLPATPGRTYREVAGARYVDDVALASSTWCARCVAASLPARYGGVPFEVQGRSESSSGSVPCLDLLLLAREGRIHLIGSRPELAWLRGEAEWPVKHRLPPWLGGAHARWQVLHSVACGRLSRWHTMQLAPRPRQQLMQDELRVWLRAGYPPAVLRRVWAGHIYAEEVVLAFLAACRGQGTEPDAEP